MEKAIFEAHKIGFNKIILYTNSVLKPAISLYEKLGFKSIKLDDSGYVEADIKMIYEGNI